MNNLKTFKPSSGLRWGTFALALLVLVFDQWSKFAVVEQLASPSHPMVAPADGIASAATLLTARGLNDGEVKAAVGSRILWRYVKVDGLSAQTPLSQAGVPAQLLATAETGYPPPRRLRVMPAARGGDLASVIVPAFSVEEAAVDSLIANSIYRAVDPLLGGEAVLAQGELVVLLRRDVEVIPSFMKLVYAENHGAAWGFMRDVEPTTRDAFFLIASTLAALGMIWAIWVGWMGSTLASWALGAVLGGALGNMIDRIHYGVVVDFILNYIGDLRWPVYNVADIGITVGVLLIAIELLWRRPNRVATESNAKRG